MRLRLIWSERCSGSSLAPRIDFATGYNAWGVAIGDLDGGGRPDIVFANSYDNTISIYQNQVPFGGPPVIGMQPQDVAYLPHAPTPPQKGLKRGRGKTDRRSPNAASHTRPQRDPNQLESMVAITRYAHCLAQSSICRKTVS